MTPSKYIDQSGCFTHPTISNFKEVTSTLLQLLINSAYIFSYCGNNPINYVDSSGLFAISSFLISLAIGSFVSWGLSEIFGGQIAGGISSVAGGALMLIGAGTIAFGANEIVAGATGTNYFQQWTGWNNDLCNGLYIGLNIASK